jgi:hypothetical protein
MRFSCFSRSTLVDLDVEVVLDVVVVVDVVVVLVGVGFDNVVEVDLLVVRKFDFFV